MNTMPHFCVYKSICTHKIVSGGESYLAVNHIWRRIISGSESYLVANRIWRRIISDSESYRALNRVWPENLSAGTYFLLLLSAYIIIEELQEKDSGSGNQV